MLWFGKKKKTVDDSIEAETVNDIQEAEDGSEEISEEEMLSLLNEEDTAEKEDMTDTETEADAQEGESEKPVAEADVIKRISSFDELVEYVGTKTIGSIQMMRKANNEVFDLKEVYLRVAEVWGSVSMAREYTPAEYAKIMLAIEVLESPDDFYVLPVVTDEEREKAIMDFCVEKYGGGGKKYARNIDRFAKLVKENGDMDDWLAHSKWVLTEKLTEFCDKNGISFDNESGTAEGEEDE